jgi:hypothetical protein
MGVCARIYTSFRVVVKIITRRQTFSSKQATLSFTKHKDINKCCVSVIDVIYYLVGSCVFDFFLRSSHHTNRSLLESECKRAPFQQKLNLWRLYKFTSAAPSSALEEERGRSLRAPTCWCITKRPQANLSFWLRNGASSTSSWQVSLTARVWCGRDSEWDQGQRGGGRRRLCASARARDLVISLCAASLVRPHDHILHDSRIQNTRTHTQPLFSPHTRAR